MSLINQIVNGFASRPEDSTDLAFEKKLILLIALTCCGFGLIWSLLYYSIFGLGLTMALPFSFTVIVGVTIWISHWRADHLPLIYAQLICITWISALIQWSIGSMDQSGIVIAWSFLGPLGAVIFLSLRQSIFWLMMFLIIIVVSVVFQPALLGEPLIVSPGARILFYLMNLGISAIVIFSASAWFVKTIQYEHTRSEGLLQKIKVLFGQHVSDEIAEELLYSNEGKTSESKSYEVTVLFLDIRDFTVFADSRAPKEVANLQNIIFSEFIDIIRTHKGISLQILGDGILAVFGAPNVNSSHPDDAIKAGFDMIDTIHRLAENGEVPYMKVGIGLHTGKVIAGVIGNEYRKFYSITGSNVIVASRIEQLNKKLDSQFLVSESVFNKADESDLKFSFKGKYQLKGISKKVSIYQLA